MDSALYNLDRPDETAELDLKDAEPCEAAKLLYEQWKSHIWRDNISASDHYRDPNYEFGLRMVRPYREKLKGVLKPEPIKNPPKFSYEWYDNGNFLSILLNGTGLERLVLDMDDYSDCVGYRLNKGKTLEICGDMEAQSKKQPKDVADFGEGGTLINRGYVFSAGKEADLDFFNHGECHYAALHAKGGKWVNYKNIAGSFATFAEGGLFVNRGTSRGLGVDAEGGIGINLGKVTQSIASKARGGLWLNFGEAHSMGSNSGGGIFISTTRVGKSWIKNHESFCNGAHGDAIVIGPQELKTDSELFDMVEAIERAAREEKYEEAEQLARKVDGHVRQNYKGRKVA
jgi:hypothetical protein